jgi:hypothetical protein
MRLPTSPVNRPRCCGAVGRPRPFAPPRPGGATTCVINAPVLEFVVSAVRAGASEAVCAAAATMSTADVLVSKGYRWVDAVASALRKSERDSHGQWSESQRAVMAMMSAVTAQKDGRTRAVSGSTGSASGRRAPHSRAGGGAGGSKQEAGGTDDGLDRSNELGRRNRKIPR